MKKIYTVIGLEMGEICEFRHFSTKSAAIAYVDRYWGEEAAVALYEDEYYSDDSGSELHLKYARAPKGV